MTAYTLSAAGYVLFSLAFLWGLRAAIQIALDCHQRGMARVHRGTSWTER